MANLFSFVIQTHSRTPDVIKLIINISELRKFDIEYKIIISDNGNRGRDAFESSGFKFDYINNSDSKDGISHLKRIYSSRFENAFFIHDDDRFDIPNLLTAIKFIQNNNPSVLISPKYSIKSITNFKNKTDVFKMYFLNYKNNCPLLSGLYLKTTQTISDNLIIQNIIKSKYADVQFMSKLLTLDKSTLFNLPFVEYNDHEFNDNNSRALSDRIKLSKYIFKQKGLSNYIMSLLVFHGYPSKIHFFLIGFCLSLFNPHIFILLIKKSIYKLKIKLQ